MNIKKDDFNIKNKKLIITKKKVKNYTLFRHYCDLMKNLKNEK